MTLIRETLADWLVDLEPNWMITHNFGYDVKQADGDPRVKHFYNCVMGRAYGRNWSKMPLGKWVKAVGVWERLDADLNPHVHCLVRARGPLQAVLSGPAVNFWKDIAPRGQLCAEPLESPERAARYVTKGVFAMASLDKLFVYAKSNDA